MLNKGRKNKMKNWKIGLLIGVLAMSVALIGCGKKDEESTEETTEETTEALVIEEVAEVVEELSEYTNLLTGLVDLTDEAIGTRPIAVMISNVAAAMPQYGISDADIIIEMPVESTLTRFMALYADYTQVPDICSVRSCRDYFPAVSEGFDAIYIHWGMDESIIDHYNAMDLDVFNGTYSDGGIFDRDSERLSAGYALEHTSMIYGGEVLVNAIESSEMRIEIEEDKTGTAFSFNPIDSPEVPDGDACVFVEVDFGASASQFNYNEEEQVYYMQYNGSDQVDGVTGIQLSFTNLFILEATITDRTDSPTRVAIDCYGVSDQVGYYVSNGAVQEIRWSKADEQSQLIFYDLDGNELEVNCGKSYISYNYADCAVFE